MPRIAGFPGIAGEALNRCERGAAVQTQDCEVSKKRGLSASSQWQAELHVSLGAVENWSFAVLRKGFSLSVGFA